MAKKDASWDEIGKTIGKKIEKEHKEKGHWGHWHSWDSCAHCQHHNSGFVGRLLFIIALLVILNHQNALVGISIWWQLLLGLGFALMTF